MTNTTPARPDSTLTVEEVWANRDVLTSRDPETDLWPHVSKVNGTVLNPPMSIETLNARNEDFEVQSDPEFAGIVGGVDITCWPSGGWMVTISLAKVAGPYHRHNTVTFTWH